MGINTQETKLNLPDDTVSKLAQLAQINLDSARGFQAAAEAVSDNGLVSEFRVWAVDRTRQAEELSKLLEFNHAEVPEDTSWSAAAHQTWLKFRAALSNCDAWAVLVETERGEDAILAKYKEVLKETASSPVNDLLQRQYADVKAAHHRVRDLRNARKRRKRK